MQVCTAPLARRHSLTSPLHSNALDNFCFRPSARRQQRKWIRAARDQRKIPINVRVGRECVLNSRVKQIFTFLTPGYMILGVDIGCLAGLIEVDDAKAQK
jgi:hypothetical protein